ncbi:hypothetical protein MferCBS31731_002815 [Microsporum ferrugineum]
MLRDAGISFDSFDSEKDGQATPSPAQQSGKLIAYDAGQKYYEHRFLAHLGDELKQNPEDDMSVQKPSARLYPSFLFLGSMASCPPAKFPSVSEIFKLWPFFCENVDPLTKILHVPSTKVLLTQTLQPGASCPIPKKIEGFIFAICTCAVMSLGDNESQRLLGTRASLESFLAATATSLVESSFMQSLDIITLQTYVLFLTAMQRDCESSCFWTMVSIVIRIAQTIGIHQDGTIFSISPYETEIRRRLWWYIVSLDIRATEMAGSGKLVVPQPWNAPLPLNINDEDISPDTATLSSEHTKVTEMSFPLLKYEMSLFLQDPGNGKFSGGLEETRTGTSLLHARIARLEKCFEERFLRFCDPVIPLHVLLTVTARSTICKLQRIAEVSYADKDQPRVLTNPETKFSYGLKMLEYDKSVHSTKSTQRFRWYIMNSFPWGAVIGLLKAITGQTTWDETKEAAWHHLEDMYQHHPEFCFRSTEICGVAGKLTLATWEIRLQAIPKFHIRLCHLLLKIYIFNTTV